MVNTVVYGAADFVVLAVGGFLLLPLYTRTLSQSEFGNYVIVKANIEIITFIMYFGLPSAVSRVYFDYKALNQHFEYMSSVLSAFLLGVVVIGVLFHFWGAGFWKILSPNTPDYPYLGFGVAIGAVGFFGALASLWLRMEGRVAAFAGLQVGVATVLALVAVVSLVVLDLGLPGIFVAVLISSACSALALPCLFGRRFRPIIQTSHIVESLRYAVPIVIGYIGYFVHNRISIFLLQRHVEPDQIAIFGIAQQLAMIVTFAGMAFVKASQSTVFSAEQAHAATLMSRSARFLMLVMFCVTSVLLLFASEMFELVAPRSYQSGIDVLLILLVGGFIYSLTLISDTALMYHRRPKTAVAVTLVGAVSSTLLGVLVIPTYHLYGAAFATVGAFLVTALAGYWRAYRITKLSYIRPALASFLAICALAVFVAWLQRQGLPQVASLSIKAAVGAILLSVTYLFFSRKAIVKP